MFWILTLLTFGVFCILSIKRYKYWQKRGVKQIFSFPPLGEKFDSLVKGLNLTLVAQKIYNKFPEARYCGFFDFSTPILMIRDPQLIREMCVKNADHFLDHKPIFSNDPDPMFSKSVFCLKGQTCKNMRSVLTPIFTGSKKKHMFVFAKECADDFVNYFTTYAEEVIDVELFDIFSKYTSNVTARTVFGISLDSMKDPENELFLRGKQMTEFTYWKTIQVLLAPWIGKILPLSFYDKEVSTFFKKVVKDLIEHQEKSSIESCDLISSLTQIKNGTFKNEDSEKLKKYSSQIKQQQRENVDLSLESITAQAMMLFVGGYETSSLTMSCLMYELAVQPDIQSRLLQELDEFRATYKILSYEGLSKLVYLDMVISETLRTRPIHYSERTCNKPYTIEPELPDEKPVTLTPGDNIWVPISALHHDPKYWKNPEKFDPERFSAENKDDIVPYTYLPFGIGPRKCIAYEFGLMVMKIVLYELLTHYEIVPTKKSCIPMKMKKSALFFASEGGLWFGLKKRNME